MSGSKDSILAIIRALAAKTTENGCTEAEALAATLKMAELMDRHGFATADLAVTEKEEITKDTYFFKGKKLGSVSFCATALGRFCDVKAWAAHVGGNASIQFFGRESDVAVARYLLHLFHTSIGHEFFRFTHTEDYARSARFRHGKTLRASFEKAMAIRLAERLDYMKRQRNQTIDAATNRTGQDLVVIKDREVAQAFDALNMKFRSTKRRYTADINAHAAGRAAGDRVSITTGIGGGYTVALIAR